MIKIKKSLVTMMTVFTLAFAGTMTAFAAETAETADTTDTAEISETTESSEMETEEDTEEGSSVVLASGAWTGKKNGAHKAASTQNQTSETLAADSAEEDTDNDLSDTTDHTSADSQTAADTQASADTHTSKEPHTSENASASDVESDNSYTDYSVQTGLISLGAFRTTAYCPCYACSEGYGRHTSTGTIAKANHTIAVDPRVIPYGSKVMINGTVYTAEDRGGAVKGHHIDIFYDTHAQTRQYGSRNVEVFLLS
jgi:3D (Asp-Asp-Asp) domain-containing protein